MGEINIVCKYEQVGKRAWEASAASGGVSATGNGSDWAVAIGNACDLLAKKLFATVLSTVEPSRSPTREERSLIGVRCLVGSGQTVNKYCRPHGTKGRYLRRDGTEGTIYRVAYEDGTPDRDEKDEFLIPQE